MPDARKFFMLILKNTKWLRGQEVKTLASHAGIRGSIPLGVTRKVPENGTFFVFGNRKVIKKVIRHMFDCFYIRKKEEGGTF